MAKKPSITTVSSGYQSTDVLNTNFTNIRDAFDNTLSRDGSTPNSMNSDLDMNSNQILNLPAATTNTEPVRKAEFDSLALSGNALFKADGTGAVDRILNDKLKETISIKDFGAVCDGVTDDTLAIQAAIDSLPSYGGVVLVNGISIAKNIRINGTNRNKQGVRLTSLSNECGLKLPNNAGAVNLIDAEDAVNCSVDTIMLDGNRANQTIPPLVDGPDYEKYNLVYLEGSSKCRVVNCSIKNAAVIAICPGAPWTGKTGASDTIISENVFDSCAVPIAAMRQTKNVITKNILMGANQTYGIVIDEYSSGNIVSNNRIDGTSDVALFLFRATENSIIGNVITDCLVSVCLSDASSDNLIANNSCTNASNSNIKLINGCLRNSITGNFTDTAAQYNIVLEAGTGASSFNNITSNKCRNASYSNIASFNGSFAKITQNYCWEADGSGIYMSGACDWSVVDENYCFRNSLNSLTDAGIRLVDINNVNVERNKCFDDAVTKTQVWGIRANEGTMGTVTIKDNDVRFNGTAGMALSGTPIVSRNQGWVTENYGNVTLGSAVTGITITHGMNMTPNYRSVRVSFVDSTVRNSKVAYIANVGATTFDVFVDAAPGANTTLSWFASVEPS